MSPPESENPSTLTSAAGLKGLVVGIIVLIATIACSAVLHHRAMAALKSEVQDKLVRAAMGVAAEIDGDLHQTFVDRAQEASPEYERALAPLRHALYWIKDGRPLRNDYRFIYTCVERDGQVFFVLDPTSAGLRLKNGLEQKSHIFQPYPRASEELRRTLATGVPQADPEPYTDEWGVFVSGYAPFFDAQGRRVGAVGVDWEAATYARRLVGIQHAWYLQIILCLASGFLSGVGTGIALVRRERIEAARRHALEEARRNRERWLIMVETLPKPAVHVQDGRLWCNAPLLAALGYTRDELATEEQWFERLCGERAAVERSRFAVERSAGFSRTIELGVRRKDGAERWFEFTAHIYHPGEVWLAQDITARRDYEAGIIAAREEAEEAARAKGTFLATVSHEIRTPMNGVIGMTNLLLEAPLDPRAREMVETIRNCGEMLVVVINDLLDFSKIESGGMELEDEPLDLRACVEDCVDLFAARAGEKGLNLVAAISPTCPGTIRGDANRLKQVLCNLIGNAVKFTAAGEIDVRVELEGDAVPAAGTACELRFSVRDTGIGIPADRHERLFKSFSQVDSSTARKYGGTGLGLAISRRLVELMGGTIGMTSAEGQGSTFRFTLRTRAEQGFAGFPEASAALGGRRVLVVSESKASLAVLESYLAQWGLRSLAAGDGAQALRRLREAPYDLVITDLQMAGMDGLELARTIGETIRPAPRLILLSALTRADIRAVAKQHGVVTVLQKPVRPGTLLQAIEETLETKSRPATEATAAAPRLSAEIPLRVLVAEDNRVNQLVARRTFEHFGYAIDLAANGKEAVALVQGSGYDIVFMDLHMPVMDGFDATRQIRAGLPAERQPKIVALTANALEGDRERCLQQGMDDYIAKPVRAADLERVLRTLAPGVIATRARRGVV